MAAYRRFAAAHLAADGLTLPLMGVPPSDSIAKDHEAQTTSYYCGPAAVKEALGQLGIGGIQGDLASALRTTTDGTAWSGVNANVPHSTGYPVPDVLNDRLSSHGINFTFTPRAVSYSPTAGEVSTFEGSLQADIYDGYPLVGDAYEVAGGPHLDGHPRYQTIFHWFDIYGYANSGGTTDYEDSVHGASSISWSGDVPAYSALASSVITTIVGGRGYVW